MLCYLISCPPIQRPSKLILPCEIYDTRMSVLTQASFSGIHSVYPCATDGKTYSSSYLAFPRLFSLCVEHYLLPLHLADSFPLRSHECHLPSRSKLIIPSSGLLWHFVCTFIGSLSVLYCNVSVHMPFFPIRFQEPWLIHSVSPVRTIVPNAAGSAQM